MANIEEIKKEYEELLDQLSDPELISDWEKFEKLSKKKKKLERIIEKQKTIEEIEKQIEESKAMLNTEDELSSLAETEIIQLKEKEKNLKKELKNSLKDNSPSLEPHSAIVEIRAGTGGKEAALFAGDRFKMYSKYAVSQDVKQGVLDSHPQNWAALKK